MCPATRERPCACHPTVASSVGKERAALAEVGESVIALVGSVTRSAQAVSIGTAMIEEICKKRLAPGELTNLCRRVAYDLGRLLRVVRDTRHSLTGGAYLSPPPRAPHKSASSPAVRS